MHPLASRAPENSSLVYTHLERGLRNHVELKSGQCEFFRPFRKGKKLRRWRSKFERWRSLNDDKVGIGARAALRSNSPPRCAIHPSHGMAPHVRLQAACQASDRSTASAAVLLLTLT
jgi:hypothetical protein